MLTVLGGLLLFCVGYFGLGPERFERLLPAGEFQDVWAYLLSKSLTGLFWMLASVNLMTWSRLALDPLWVSPVQVWQDLFWAGLFFLPLTPFLWVSAKRPAIQEQYPELRRTDRGTLLVIGSALAWFVFLCGYECLFRGLILGQGIALVGVGKGIALMTALYVLAHVHKSRSEMLACFVVGPLFAGLVLWQGSIWSAVFLHTLIAVTTENWAARARKRANLGG
jgi:membrane protease YdiL (CAAX protease family)